MQTFRAVLFDFDGTLADSFDGIAASVNHVRGLHGLPPLSVAEVKRHVGRGPAYLLSHTVDVGDIEANVAAYKAHHPSVLRSGTRLFPGAAETLKALHEGGVKTGVCSNKPVAFTRQLLEIFGIAAYLDVVLGPEDVARAKPAPDMLQAAMKRLGVTPLETLYIGDMAVDIETARAAGVTVWVVPTGSDEPETLRQAKPDRMLKGLREKTTVLTGLMPAE